jgi:hypothetical protein
MKLGQCLSRRAGAAGADAAHNLRIDMKWREEVEVVGVHPARNGAVGFV